MAPKRSLAAIRADAASMGKGGNAITSDEQDAMLTVCLLREASWEVVRRKMVLRGGGSRHESVALADAAAKRAALFLRG